MSALAGADVAGWQLAATVLAVIAPLVGIPLTVITFYLKALRDQQAGRLTDLANRLAVLDAAVQRVRDDVAGLHRDAATKEEWLRESMWARSRIEQLSAALTRAIAELEQVAAAPALAERAARAVTLLEERVAAGGGEVFASCDNDCAPRGEELG